MELPTEDHVNIPEYMFEFLMLILQKQYFLFTASLIQFISFQHAAIIIMIAPKMNHLQFVKEQRNFIKEFVKVKKMVCILSKRFYEVLLP